MYIYCFVQILSYSTDLCAPPSFELTLEGREVGNVRLEPPGYPVL